MTIAVRITSAVYRPARDAHGCGGSGRRRYRRRGEVPKTRRLVLARGDELCDEQLLDVSEGKETHLQLVEIRVYVRCVVVEVILAARRALDDGVLVI